MRLNDHVQYLKKVEATLRGEEDFHGTTHHACKLGQWLYGDGPDDVATLQENQRASEIFASLYKIHEHFHIVSNQVLEKNKIGDKYGTQVAMTEMYKLSSIIAQKLLDLDTLSLRKDYFTMI